MKKILLASLIAGLSMVSVNFAAPQTNLNNNELIQHFQKVKNDSQLLFIFSSNNAKIESVSGNQYKITFEHVDKYVKYFSDRPAREVGIIPFQTFLKTWSEGKDSFANNPPNAAVNGELSNKNGHISYVFTLSDPQYNAGNNSLTFNATLNRLGNKGAVASNLGFNSVFIDFSWSNNN